MTAADLAPVVVDMLAEYRAELTRVGRGHDTFDVRVIAAHHLQCRHGDDSAQSDYAWRRVGEWPD